MFIQHILKNKGEKMIGKKIEKEKPATLIEVKEIIGKRKKLGELSYEQKITYDYVKRFAKVGKRKIDVVIDKLKAEGIDEKTAVKLINLKPTNAAEVKLVFEKVRFDLKEPQIKKILDLMKELKA